MKVKVTQSCLTLCDPMDCTVHGILQARILEWVTFPFSRGSSQLRDWAQVFCIAGGFFTSWATRRSQKNRKWLIRKNIINEFSECYRLCNPGHFRHMFPFCHDNYWKVWYYPCFIAGVEKIKWYEWDLPWIKCRAGPENKSVGHQSTKAQSVGHQSTPKHGPFYSCWASSWLVGPDVSKYLNLSQFLCWGMRTVKYVMLTFWELEQGCI